MSQRKFIEGEESEPSKVVLDTNIYISSLFWRGTSYEIIQQALHNTIDVYISEIILLELDRVLERDFSVPENKRKEMIQTILMFAHLVFPKEKVSVVRDDPDDDAILECAIESGARVIISQDKHLLRIKKFKNISVVHPQDYLEKNS